MSVYRTINSSFWTDPKVRALPKDGKLLMLYLVTCPHAHVGGIYYIPEVTIAHETGLQGKGIDTLWDTLADSGLVWRDKKSEVVWVVNMLHYQGRGKKVYASVANQLCSLHNSNLVNKFLQRYPAVAAIYRDRVSIGIPAQDGNGKQEQEQEQDTYKTADTDRTIIGVQEPVGSAALEVCDSVPVWAESERLATRLAASMADFDFGHRVAALVTLGKLSGALVAECAEDARKKKPNKPLGMFRTILRAECKKKRIDIERLAGLVKLPSGFDRGPPVDKNGRESVLSIVNALARKDSP